MEKKGRMSIFLELRCVLRKGCKGQVSLPTQLNPESELPGLIKSWWSTFHMAEQTWVLTLCPKLPKSITNSVVAPLITLQYHFREWQMGKPSKITLPHQESALPRISRVVSTCGWGKTSIQSSYALMYALVRNWFSEIKSRETGPPVVRLYSGFIER